MLWKLFKNIIQIVELSYQIMQMGWYQFVFPIADPRALYSELKKRCHDWNFNHWRVWYGLFPKVKKHWFFGQKIHTNKNICAMKLSKYWYHKWKNVWKFSTRWHKWEISLTRHALRTFWIHGNGCVNEIALNGVPAGDDLNILMDNYGKRVIEVHGNGF